MVVDNFNLIEDFMTFPNERSFYFVQILKRRKENPEMKAFSRQIECYYIFDKEQFERFKPHIIEKCQQNRARAYIKLNVLDAQSVAYTNVTVIMQELRKQNWKALSSCFNMACGQCGKQDGFEKIYLIDIDNVKDIDALKPYVDCVEECTPHNGVSKVKLIVPTLNGTHLITTGFNLSEFKNKYKEVDIHEDGNTILYVPDLNKKENEK